MAFFHLKRVQHVSSKLAIFSIPDHESLICYCFLFITQFISGLWRVPGEFEIPKIKFHSFMGKQSQQIV